jgi:hypothetical protein
LCWNRALLRDSNAYALTWWFIRVV